MSLPSIWGINYEEGFDRFGIQQHFQTELYEWFENAVLPSHFLLLVLNGELLAVMSYPDRSNHAALLGIARFVRAYAPIYSYQRHDAVMDIEGWPQMVTHRRFIASKQGA